MAEGYSATTRGIRVAVQPFYLEDQSEPDESRFVWAYRVQIENTGPIAVPTYASQLAHHRCAGPSYRGAGRRRGGGAARTRTR